MSDSKSFKAVDTHRSDFLNRLQPENPEKFPFVLIGNKSDKEEQREVPASEVNEYLESKEKMIYIETSAKEQINVEKGFEEVARLFLEQK